MFNIDFHPEVQEEIRESYEWYQSKSEGLGDQFLSEIEKTLKRVEKNPKRHPLISQNIRRCLVNKFPFGVLYSNSEAKIFVVAIMHLKRRPNYWAKRSKND